MVLEIEANPGQIYNGFDSHTTEFLRITNSRPLEDKRGAKSPAADDYLLASSVDLALRLAAIQGLCRDRCNANGPSVLDNDSVHFCIALQMEVRMLTPGAMDVCVSGITATA